MRQPKKKPTLVTERRPPREPLLDLPEIMEATEVARALHITPVHARRKMANGLIPSRKFGRRRYCLRTTILKLLRPERGLGPRTPAPEPEEPSPLPPEATE